jgi:hypothetical protein
MKVWYCPSWHGDWRLEARGLNEDQTRLSVEKPTPSELLQIEKLVPVFIEKGWMDRGDGDRVTKAPYLAEMGGKESVVLKAKLSEVGPVVTSILQPGVAILTAVHFHDGHVEVCETSKVSETADPKDAAKPSEAVKEIAAKGGAEKAATVKRPTPCCPNCYVDAIGPATDVLLTFLDKEQHETWAKDRFLIVRGGITGHRYIIAHRHSPIATMQFRIAFDLDDRQVMHFHDWTVPPEEEVLAAMLILKHREPWLRNEATALGSHRHKFKNPFGDGMDGVKDSMWTTRVGKTLANITR